MQLNKEEWEQYWKDSDALRERGVLVGDVLVCDKGARLKPHPHTGKMCVRISEYCIIDGMGPRFFVHDGYKGLVAYVPEFKDENQVIPAGTKLEVVKKFESSVVLKCQ